MQGDLEVRDLLQGLVNEVTVEASQNSLVAHHHYGLPLPLQLEDHPLHAVDHVLVALTLRV